MGLYRLECENCGYVEDDVICSFNSIKEKSCEKCGKKHLKNIGFCTSFELKYNPKTDLCSWGFDNYNSSRYYDGVNQKNEAESKTIVSGPSYSGKQHIYKANNEN